MTNLAFSQKPFNEAIGFLKQKVNLPTKRWNDLWEGMHSRAFVVAGAMKGDLLTDLHGALNNAIKDGTTIAQFRKDFDKTVQKHGWNYKGKRGWRTSVIFNTNMRTTYSAGAYAQMTDPDVLKARPYWRYIGGLSGDPRPLHLEWSGTVLPANDPWWSTHWPPNGWGCKCKTVSHSKRELERDGRKVSKKAPENGEYQWTDKKTGETITVPQGIDPGWAYNPGRAAWGESEAKRLMENKGPWKDLNPWGPEKYKRPAKITADAATANLGAKATTVKELRSSLQKAIGGDEVAFVDPIGEKTLVTQAIADHILEKPKMRWDGREAYFPFIKELIEEPYEIWISFAKNEVSGRVGIRKKYVKAIKLEGKRVIGLYAETMNGQWVSGDMFRGGMSGAKNLRKGRLLYGR